MPAMGFQNTKVWMGGGWVAGVSFIEVNLEFFYFAKPIKLSEVDTHQRCSL